MLHGSKVKEKNGMVPHVVADKPGVDSFCETGVKGMTALLVKGSSHRQRYPKTGAMQEMMSTRESASSLLAPFLSFPSLSLLASVTGSP